MSIEKPKEQQLAKLPVWAQSYITRLEESERRARELVEEIRSGSKPGYFAFHDVGRDYGKYHYLPEYAIPVVFPDKREQTLQLRVRTEGVLEVCSMHGIALAAYPSAANVLLIEATEGPWRRRQL